MKPTEALKQDHRVIERLIAVLENACDELQEGKQVPTEVFEKALDFIRNFADSCHHGKEESNLFPTLERLGIPKEGGPIGVMLFEHEQGRSYVKGLAAALEKYKAGDEDARLEIIANALGYAQTLRDHIFKEDNILFRLADGALSERDEQALMESFERVEKERIGEGKHQEYVRLVEELESVVKA